MDELKVPHPWGLLAPSWLNHLRVYLSLAKSLASDEQTG